MNGAYGVLYFAGSGTPYTSLSSWRLLAFLQQHHYAVLFTIFRVSLFRACKCTVEVGPEPGKGVNAVCHSLFRYFFLPSSVCCLVYICSWLDMSSFATRLSLNTQINKHICITTIMAWAWRWCLSHVYSAHGTRYSVYLLYDKIISFLDI